MELTVNQHNTDNKDNSVNGIVLLLTDKEAVNRLVEVVKERFKNKIGIISHNVRGCIPYTKQSTKLYARTITLNNLYWQSNIPLNEDDSPRRKRVIEKAVEVTCIH
jgi:hypothetical protein